MGLPRRLPKSLEQLHHPALKGSGDPFFSWSLTLKGLVAKRPTSSFSFSVRYFFHLQIKAGSFQ